MSIEPEVEAVDAYSIKDREDYFKEEQAKIKMRKILESVGMNDEMLDDGDPSQPKTEEELAIKKDFTWKHNLAIMAEEGLAKVFMDNAMDEQREKNREGLIKHGAGGFRIDTDSDTGMVKIRSVDIQNFICSATSDPFMNDIWFAGEIKYELISTIRGKVRYASEDELEILAIKNQGLNGNADTLTSESSGGFRYDSARIPVLDLVYKKNNTTVYERKELQNGNFHLGKAARAKNNTDRRTYYKDQGNDICRVKWVIGTDLVYDFGLESDTVRKISKIHDAQLSFVMVAPQLEKMETTSLVEELIPIVDAIHIAWYKLQNVIAQARPRGIQIEIGALEDVPLMGDNGEPLKPMDLIDLYQQRGMLVYREMDAPGRMSNRSPITELNNGLGTEAQEYFAVIQPHFAMIKSMVGLNDITDASTVDPKTLNGVASLSVEATNNALHHIFNAERNVLERASDNIVQRVHDSIVFKKSKYYNDSLGVNSIKELMGSKKISFREYGVKVRFAPTARELEKLEIDVTKALDSGQITLADKFAIMHITNIKQAEQVLAYRIKKNAEDQHAREIEKITATTNQQKEAAVIAEEEKRKTAEFLEKLKRDTITHEYEKKKELAVVEFTGKTDVQAKANEGKSEQQDKISNTAIQTAAMKQNASV